MIQGAAAEGLYTLGRDLPPAPLRAGANDQATPTKITGRARPLSVHSLTDERKTEMESQDFNSAHKAYRHAEAAYAKLEEVKTDEEADARLHDLDAALLALCATDAGCIGNIRKKVEILERLAAVDIEVEEKPIQALVASIKADLARLEPN
jgi:hypothetical protein